MGFPPTPPTHPQPPRPPTPNLPARSNHRMPELPEVEITARLIGATTAGARVESTLAPGINARKTYDPPLASLDGRAIGGVKRRGKLFLVEFDGELTVLIDPMSAGRQPLTPAHRCATEPHGCWCG